MRFLHRALRARSRRLIVAGLTTLISNFVGSSGGKSRKASVVSQVGCANRIDDLSRMAAIFSSSCALDPRAPDRTQRQWL